MTSPRLGCASTAREGSKQGACSNGHKPVDAGRDHSPCGEWHSIPPFESTSHAGRQGLLGIDCQGRCTFVNQAAADMLGLCAADAVGRKISSQIRLHRSDGTSYSADQLLEAVALLDGKAGQVERGTLCRRDGVSFPTEFSLFPVTEDGFIQGVVISFVNTLERERLEQRYRQAQKMETLGRLAGGIAHDFNNLLTAILGYSELLRAGVSNNEPFYHEIVEINKAAQRAASLTSQLLHFSRQRPITPQCVDLNVLLADMERMIRRLLGPDVELQMALNPSLACIRADQGQMEQVVLNLAVNARDAMPRGGQLTIVTANVEGGTAGPKNGSGFCAGPYVMLEFKDTGCGMDEPTRVRIFEPFFTTKGPGQGTGMGLATVHSIVQENQGFIEVTSRPGEGTSFQIYLPRFAQRQEAPPGPPVAHACTPAYAGSPMVAAARRGAETVLLVEDEDTLRDLVQSILARYGYHVLKAGSAAEALQMGQHHPEPIHLLLTDLLMPQMSGQQLTQQMALVRPEMKVLYMSGSADDTIARHCLSQQDLPLIRKPFTPIDLARRVRETLDDGTRSERDPARLT